MASVSGWRAGEVKRRRRDGGNGAGAQRRRQAADESRARLALSELARTNRPEMTRTKRI
jgi:hypothetical protein